MIPRLPGKNKYYMVSQEISWEKKSISCTPLPKMINPAPLINPILFGWSRAPQYEPEDMLYNVSFLG